MPYTESSMDMNLHQYFSSLPPSIQKKIKQSGVKLETIDEMRRYVNKLDKKV